MRLAVTPLGIRAMQNRDKWKPSKFVYKSGHLAASSDPAEVGVGSRLVADTIAKFYDRNLKLHARGKLLDLGCGKVPLYAAYREFVTENTCVDWGNTLHKNPYLDRELDLTKHLPFDDGVFDTIILSDVLEHIPVPEYLWREMARILSRNGKLIMNVPFFYWLHEVPHDYYRYTEFALRRFVEVSGMRLVELVPMGGAPEIMVDIFAKGIAHLPKPLAACLRIAYSPVAALTNTAACRKFSKLTQSDFPLGYVTVAQKLRPTFETLFP